MASPQLENGHTRIANELLEALCRARLSGNEYMCVLWIARKSYGWNARKTLPMGIRKMANEIKAPPTSVHLALRLLIEKKIIHLDDLGRYSINKDYDDWISHHVQPAVHIEPLEVYSQLYKSVQPVVQPVQPTVQSVQPVVQSLYKVLKDTINTTVKESKDICTIPPNIENVKKYCYERGKGIDPEQWMDHYAARGWMIGKNKMKDWKAAIRTWERNNFAAHSNHGQNGRIVGAAAPTPGKFDKVDRGE